MIPIKAITAIPILVSLMLTTWSDDIDLTPYIASQIEQESCISLKHSKCWDPTVELKVRSSDGTGVNIDGRLLREYGFGIGQITITKRFNNFVEAKKLDPRLSTWRWEDRYNIENQMLFIVKTDQNNYNKYIRMAKDKYNAFCFSMAGYNGGYGSVIQRRNICNNTPGCDPDIWFGNLEKYSNKSKRVQKGYSKSFHDINNEYVYNVMRVRFVKYLDYINDENLFDTKIKPIRSTR